MKLERLFRSSPSQPATQESKEPPQSALGERVREWANEAGHTTVHERAPYDAGAAAFLDASPRGIRKMLGFGASFVNAPLEVALGAERAQSEAERTAQLAELQQGHGSERAKRVASVVTNLVNDISSGRATIGEGVTRALASSAQPEQRPALAAMHEAIGAHAQRSLEPITASRATTPIDALRDQGASGEVLTHVKLSAETMARSLRDMVAFGRTQTRTQRLLEHAERINTHVAALFSSR